MEKNYDLLDVMKYSFNIFFKQIRYFLPILILTGLFTYYGIIYFVKRAVNYENKPTNIGGQMAYRFSSFDILKEMFFNSTSISILIGLLIFGFVVQLFINTIIKYDSIENEVRFKVLCQYMAKNWFVLLKANILFGLVAFIFFIIIIIIIVPFLGIFVLFPIAIYFIHLLSIYIYAPIVAYLRGNTYRMFDKSKQYMTGHIGGSFIFILVGGIIDRYLSSTFSKMLALYYIPPKDHFVYMIPNPTFPNILTVYIIMTIVSFYFALCIPSYITFGFKAHTIKPEPVLLEENPLLLND